MRCAKSRIRSARPSPRSPARHPKIDVLINNAAIYEPFFIKDATDEQILQPILTNFAGPVFTIRAAIPMMEKGGYIINVTSESVALEFPLLSMYQSSKAGLERFTQSLSKELEPDGIRVSTVRCGPMMEEGKGSNWESGNLHAVLPALRCRRD